MRLNFLKPHLITQALTKVFAPNTPKQQGFRVKTVDSFIVELKKPTAVEILKLFMRMADQGYAYLCGQLGRNLVAESRKGHTNPDSYTSILSIDFDNVRSHDGLPVKVEHLIADIPVLNQYSYIVQYSASHGIYDPDGNPIKAGLNAHVFFLLDKPIPLSLVKFLMPYLSMKYLDWACHLKDQDPDNLELPMGESTGRPSQILSLTPPTVRTPYTDHHKGPRIKLVAGTSDYVDSDELLALIDSKITNHSDYIRKRKLVKLNSLREVQDLAPLKPQMASRSWDGTTRAVLENPTPHTMIYVSDDNGFSRYYREGGDSTAPAYYHPIEQPAVMGSFNGSYPPCDFQALDPKAYAEACQRVDQAVETVTKPVQSIFYDPQLKSYFGFKLNNVENTLVIENQGTKGNAEQYMDGDSLPIPDRIPNWRMVFEPTSDFLIKDGQVNRHVMPPLIRSIPPSHRSIDRSINPAKLSPDDLLAWMEANTPGLKELLVHVCGGSTDMMLHFMNWVFYQVQTGKRPESAYVFTGRTGTGKGLLTKKFLQPLFGISTKIITPSDIGRDFNDWMVDGRLIVVDEGSGHQKATRTIQSAFTEIRHHITDPTIRINQKFLPSLEVPNYLAFVFTANSHDPVYIENDDRRYNVAPRQEARLNTILGRPVWNDDYRHRVAVDEIFEREIRLLVDMLFTYEVDVSNVMNPQENDAKQKMKDVVKAVPEVFLNKLEEGDLDFFVNHWIGAEEQGAMGMENMLAITAIKTFLEAVCSILSADEKAVVPISITMGHALFANVAGRNIDRFKEEQFRALLRYSTLEVQPDETGRDYLQIKFKIDRYQPSAILARLNGTPGEITDMLTPEFKEMH